MIYITAALILTLSVLVYAIRTRYKSGLSRIPGPFIASISNLWKISAVYHGEIHTQQVKVHEKYGPVVRIGPNDVSFASASAAKQIYRSRPVFAKASPKCGSDFYKAVSPLHNGKRLFNVFSTQDDAYHAKLKRKIGTLYTKAAALEMEPLLDSTIKVFLDKMHQLTASGPHNVDLSLWLHLYAFDSLGDISSSRRFGFLENGKDVGGMIERVDKIYHMTGLLGQASWLQTIQLHVKDYMSRRNPNPLLSYCTDQVTARLEKPTANLDLLDGTLNILRRNPTELSVDEVVSSMYINLIAGQHVLAITLRALVYYLAKYPSCLQKLRAEFAEVDAKYALPSMIPYAELSKLPYLEATIYESLRVHANTGLMLERVVPAEGATIDGYFVPGGTVVGVNAWVLHRDEEVFGKDVDSFRPERWMEPSQEKVNEMKGTMFSFGDGSRRCIGQNIAMVQMTKLLVEFLRRYDISLKDPTKEWHVHGSWVARQSEMDIVVTGLRP
ncbi:cytochrome P450 oxidoreductase [Periconia macrospinosa]|uniref:Cytochrome P450 oxidoreductase n=1 Tax=Periconia macrospinosa TaxID=97972 RepID=A0A2V1DU25_9PLEO|nr:cytochrome P450 oxidoreductase [Periconia macrospinosa]